MEGSLKGQVKACSISNLKALFQNAPLTILIFPPPSFLYTLEILIQVEILGNFKRCKFQGKWEMRTEFDCRIYLFAVTYISV